MVRVLFDDQIFGWTMAGGIPRYFGELIAAFRGRSDIEPIVSAPLVREPLLRRYLGVRTKVYDPRTWLANSETVARYVNARALDRRLARRDFDVAHVTYNGAHQFDAGIPFVFTVHDLIPEKLAEQFPKVRREFQGKPKLIRDARRLITVSEYVKKELVERYRVDPARVDVIHHGMSPSLVYRPGAAAPALPSRFLMHIGMRHLYKNFLPITPVLAEILRCFPGLYLLCVGGDELNADEMAPFERLSCADRVVRAVLTDDELAWAYAHADLLFVPSLSEGFGMPLVEAFANGCPVASSSRTALPEIGGDAPLYFDPENPAEIESVLIRILSDKDLSRHLSERGRHRAAHFSWDRAADEHVATYRKAQLPQ